jgi:antitoxin CcdA
LSEAVHSEARELGINISRACESALVIEIYNERIRRWKESYSTGFEACGVSVQRNGSLR